MFLHHLSDDCVDDRELDLGLDGRGCRGFRTDRGFEGVKGVKGNRFRGRREGWRRGRVCDSGDVGGIGADDGVGDSSDVVTALCLQLRVDVVGKNVRQEIVDGVIDGAIDNVWELDSDDGDACSHRHRKKTLLATSRPGKRSQYSARGDLPS